MEKGLKLIEDANELLMQLRIKSKKETVNEKQLYDVQMMLYKALDQLRQPAVSGSLPLTDKVLKQFLCAYLEVGPDEINESAIIDFLKVDND